MCCFRMAAAKGRILIVQEPYLSNLLKISVFEQEREIWAECRKSLINEKENKYGSNKPIYCLSYEGLLRHFGLYYYIIVKKQEVLNQ